MDLDLGDRWADPVDLAPGDLMDVLEPLDSLDQLEMPEDLDSLDHREQLEPLVHPDSGVRAMDTIKQYNISPFD